MKMKMKILALIDPSFDMDSNDELAEIKEYFEYHFPKEKWEFEGLVGEVQHFVDRKADIYVYDFGGIGVGAPGLVNSTNRALVKKIENEPGRLFIIWSQFTSDVFWEQAEKDYPEIIGMENVMTRGYRDESTYRFDRRVASWLGIPEKEIAK